MSRENSEGAVRNVAGLQRELLGGIPDADQDWGHEPDGITAVHPMMLPEVGEGPGDSSPGKGSRSRRVAKRLLNEGLA